MPLTSVEESLLLAAYYRGGNPKKIGSGGKCDEVVTLSLFYTGDISREDCAERFSRRSYVGKLYDSCGRLKKTIKARYRELIRLIREHPELIEGRGNLETPADPTYTECRLTHAGFVLARTLIESLPVKPEFPNWPDRGAEPPGVKEHDFSRTANDACFVMVSVSRKSPPSDGRS
ncbi:MAG TPA: hypothetical protein VG826_30830 [Pirellulales bacterium]|nr:hypothetical protein [Pirellulales bacterium]